MQYTICTQSPNRPFMMCLHGNKHSSWPSDSIYNAKQQLAAETRYSYYVGHDDKILYYASYETEQRILKK